VTIVRQPVKVGMRDGRVYAEVHRENAPGDDNFFDEAVRLLTKKKLLKYVNTEKLYRVIEQGRGIPVDISD
jgi:L,D-transpeptidase ErfK/SrfK